MLLSFNRTCSTKRSSLAILAVSFACPAGSSRWPGVAAVCAGASSSLAFGVPRQGTFLRPATTTRCYSIDPTLFHNLPRLYTDNPLSSHSVVPLDANQANYLNVMRIHNRKRWGDLAGNIRLFNGRDGEWLAKILVGENNTNEANSKQRRRKRSSAGGSDPLDDMVVECLETLREQPKASSTNSPQIVLHMGRIKKPRRKWILEKVTELGIDGISILDTEYSAKEDAWEQEKHRLHVMEAAEQCERMTLPTLEEESWESLLEQIRTTSSPDVDHTTPGSKWLVCRERSPDSQPLWAVISSTMASKTPTAFHLLVGPEGGWSPQELEDLSSMQTTEGCPIQFVSLGALILRAETAAIAAVTAVVLAKDTQYDI